jgi:hypothetical protein
VDRAFRRACVVAAFVHAALLVRVVRDARTPGDAVAPRAEAPPEEVELVTESGEPAPSAPPAAAAPPALAIAPAHAPPLGHVAPSRGRPSVPAETAPHGEIITAPRGTTEIPSVPPVASARTAPSSASDVEARLDKFDPNKRPSWMPSRVGEGVRVPATASSSMLAQKVSKDLAQGADDRTRGAGGYGGPVVSAAHDAAMGTWAPQTGFAIIAVDLDEHGAVARVSLVDASGDRADWQKVANDVQKGLEKKKIDVPSGSNGVRVTVRIDAKLALPSGATSRFSGPSFGNDGTQATASVAFDLSDVGQKPRRMVGVVVVSETRL